MAWLLNNLETIWKAFAGLVIFIVGLVWRKNLIEKGHEQAEKEIAEANLDAVKKS